MRYFGGIFMSLGTWYLPSRSRKNQGELENGHFLHIFWGRYVRQQGIMFMTRLFFYIHERRQAPQKNPQPSSENIQLSSKQFLMQHWFLLGPFWSSRIWIKIQFRLENVGSVYCRDWNKRVFTSGAVKHTPPPPPRPTRPHKPSVKGQIKP